MHLNIHVLPRLRGLLVVLAMVWLPAESQGQATCPAATGRALEAGWHAYHENALEHAISEFERARRLCPASADAVTGLGFVYLRQGRSDRADSLFRSALLLNPSSSDAWEGRARSAFRVGDTLAAVAAGRRVMALAPTNSDFRRFLDQISPEWNRGPVTKIRSANLQLVGRTRGRGFEIATSTGWQPFYVRGVNLGVALPGKFPSQFPVDSSDYAGWLDTIATMHANTVRVYTILPPAFYRALRGWNVSHPDRLLWLVHGVWAELPPGHNFDDARWKDEFQTEMRRVVDLVHGSASFPVRPGHAGGHFDADVSPWVLAYIIGREWEPYAVKAFNATHSAGAFAGHYLQLPSGPAMDLWLTRQCDLMLSYEADTYNALRPIAYTSWPTLDPLHHPTEATTAEEALWRSRSGRHSEAKKLEYENDAVTLDPTLVRPTAANPAGWFASYHAYPYYPDFMILDPGYRTARSPEGPSSYLGYLQALVAYHAHMPTLISEYGVPSSRGVAHIHPLGWSHGGHDEQSMASIDARLTREIREAGAAGSILFAWLDEWFKKNWTVIDYEIPAENTRLWHNIMDPEQNYGVIGEYAGNEKLNPRLGGNPQTWRALPVLQQVDPHSPRLRNLRIGSNESFVFIAADVPPGKFPWGSLTIQLAIDTYLPAVGQHRLPGSLVSSGLGFEFLIQLEAPDTASMKVTPEYNRYDARVDPATGDDYGRFARRPVTTRDRQDGRFDPLFIVTNRARFGRDGTFFRAQRYDRGQLRFGAESESTLADWYLDEAAGLLELRVPWDLLNVTDPSSRRILHDERGSGAAGTREAGVFHWGILLYSKVGAGQVIAALPATVGDQWPAESFMPWSWEGWSVPTHYARLKPVYDSLRALWREAPGGGPTPPAPTAPSN
jgi:Tetratricopeptide repeat